MDLALARRVALVTGATRGIGQAIARALAREDCTVALNARNVVGIESSLSRIGNDASIHRADVTDPSQARELVEGVIKVHGQIDIIVCNVGSGASVPPGEETLEEWHRVFEVNLWSAINVVDAGNPHLNEGSSIIFISSICGLEALGAPVAYSAAKAALNAAVKNLSRPLGRRGIRINAVVPGNILFEGGVWERKMKDEPQSVAAILNREVPLGRLGSPDDVANMVVFLASPRCGFVTGAFFVVDGGQLRS